jgi:hypothetical protein
MRLKRVVSTKLPIREREASTAHLDGRCVKVHETTVLNVLKRNTLILIALRVQSDAHSIPFGQVSGTQI